MAARKATEYGKTTFFTHNLLLRAAGRSLKLAKQGERDRLDDCLNCLVSVAFALEGYLNHIGLELFKFWPHLERNTPREKLGVICSHLRLRTKFDCRPFQSFIYAFKVRNLAAHSRPESVTYEARVDLEADPFSRSPGSKLIELCKLNATEQVYEDGKKIIRIIHEKAGRPKQEISITAFSRFHRIPDSG